MIVHGTKIKIEGSLLERERIFVRTRPLTGVYSRSKSVKSCYASQPPRTNERKKIPKSQSQRDLSRGGRRKFVPKEPVQIGLSCYLTGLFIRPLLRPSIPVRLVRMNRSLAGYTDPSVY